MSKDQLNVASLVQGFNGMQLRKHLPCTANYHTTFEFF